MSLLRRIEQGPNYQHRGEAGQQGGETRTLLEIREDLEEKLRQQQAGLRYEVFQLTRNLSEKDRSIAQAQKNQYEINIQRIEEALAKLPGEDAASAYHGRQGWGT